MSTFTELICGDRVGIGTDGVGMFTVFTGTGGDGVQFLSRADLYIRVCAAAVGVSLCDVVSGCQVVLSVGNDQR